MNLSPKLQIFIISWAGWHENAATIHDGLRAHCDKICIVYSDPDDRFEFVGDIDAIRRPNDLMFGDKFYACLHSFSGDIFLLLHADCHCSDWAGLATACVNDFIAFPEIGVWSPVVSNSYPSLEMAEVSPIPNSNLSIVANTDCIIIGLCPLAIERLRRCDFIQNRHGWWAHVPALVFCFLRGRHAVMNRSIFVEHTPGRGYSSGTAASEGELFLKNMSIQEYACWLLFVRYYRYPREKCTFRKFLLDHGQETSLWRFIRTCKGWLATFSGGK